MNKAKALFAAAIVVAVAGSSALLLHFNEKGVIDFQDGNNDGNVLTTVATTNSNSYQDNQDDDSDDAVTEAVDDAVSDEKISTTDVNEFLSVFSKVYFSENNTYSMNNADDYELIRFAYSYAMMNNRDDIKTEYVDDEIGYYNKISASYVNDVLSRYFDKTVSKESVFTEKTYSFFKYSDGYFYTPAADGISYTNVSISDNIAYDDNIVSVDFSIYSSGVTTDMTSQQARRASEDRYATGSAKFHVEDGNYILRYYKIDR